MRILLVSCCSILLALLATPAAAQTTIDMSVHPTSDGCTEIAAGSGTGTVAGGILTIDTTAPPSSHHGYFVPAADWESAAFTPQYLIEASVRLTSQPETSNASHGGIHIISGDGLRKTFLSIFTDHIELTTVVDAGPYTGTTTYAMDTTAAYHTYSIAVDGAQVDVAVDGVPRLSATNSGSSSQDYLYFGDGLYANDTISDWDWVSFTSTSVVTTERNSWSQLKGIFR